MLMQDLLAQDPQAYAKEWAAWQNHNPEVHDWAWWDDVVEGFFEDRSYLRTDEPISRLIFDIDRGKCAIRMYVSAAKVLEGAGYFDTHPIESLQFIEDLPEVFVVPDRMGWMNGCYLNFWCSNGGVGLFDGYSLDTINAAMDSFVDDNALHDVFTRFAKEVMGELLKQLEEQYEYLTSEEYFLEREYENV